MSGWSELILASIGLLLGIIAILLAKLRRDLDLLSVHNTPRDREIEAAWEDIGAHGRWLTDLGGMSIAMKEQLFIEFKNALNEPITTVPKAGSINDILCDMDKMLTELERKRDSKSTD